MTPDEIQAPTDNQRELIARLDKIIELLSAPKPVPDLTPTPSVGCGHIFPWNSIMPPTKCQVCGAPLGTSQEPNVQTYTTNTTNTTVVSLTAKEYLPMTPDEIQALPVPASLTESVSNREDTADDQICEHIIGLWRLEHGWDVVLHGDTTYEFTYCPKCGEKL